MSDYSNLNGMIAILKEYINQNLLKYVNNPFISVNKVRSVKYQSGGDYQLKTEVKVSKIHYNSYLYSDWKWDVFQKGYIDFLLSLCQTYSDYTFDGKIEMKSNGIIYFYLAFNNRRSTEDDG